MENGTGVYLVLTPDGKLKRDLMTAAGKIQMEDSTVEHEIIEFSELVFGPYTIIVDYIIQLVNSIVSDYNQNDGHIDRETFNEMKAVVDDLVQSLESEDLLHGTLTRTAVEDAVPKDDGSDRCAAEIVSRIAPPLQEVFYFQILTNQILSDLRNGVPLDFKEKYRSLQRSDVIQTFFMDGELTARYYFRTPANYYRFLLLNFILRKPTVEWCKCCGRFFIPRTKKKTSYCDRIMKDGASCKVWGPRLKHRKAAMDETVIEEFDRTRQKMYKRYERTRDMAGQKSEKPLTLTELYLWIDEATLVRDKYLAGEISKEDALKAIVVP